MRSIEISTVVFSRIWALRVDGEETESDILQRLLFSRDVEHPEGGLLDTRFGVWFREGFTVFRTYHGTRYVAVVRDGKWHLDGTNATSETLNSLSRLLGAKTENAWQNWLHTTPEGPRPVSVLRQSRVTNADKKKEERRVVPMKMSTKVRWVDDVVAALRALGGRSTLDKIYATVEAIRRDGKRSVPASLDATIRRTLEDHSSDSANYRGQDLFCLPQGKGAGVWALRD